VVDLDGGLLPSAARHEDFWAGISSDWRGVFDLPRALAGRRPCSEPRGAKLWADRLPYDRAVLDHVRAWRATGGRAVLVTASAQHLADAVSAHLGVFDAAHGPEALISAPGFVYLTGRSPDQGLLQRAARVVPAKDMAGKRATPWPYLRAMRPHQWVKNTLVFLPLLLAHRFSADVLLQSFFAFVAFCLVASGVYVLNDLADLATDRAHPRKRNRPFAAGDIPLERGAWMALALFVPGLGIALWLGTAFLWTMIGYVAVTTAYSLSLKHRFLLDILTLAALYSLRIIAGAVATGMALSGWLLGFAVFFFFSLASVKRLAELVGGPAHGHPTGSGHGYDGEDLPLVQRLAVGTGVASVLVLAVYINVPAVRALYSAPGLLWGVCAVILAWLGWIVLTARRGRVQDDPVRFAVTDWFSWLSLALVAALATLGRHI